jgi:hypothetical protein
MLFVIAAINPGYAGFPYIDAVLKLGVALAMIPFGGVDGSVLPTWAVAVLGSLFNGAVGVFLASATLWFYRRGEQTRASAIDHLSMALLSIQTHGDVAQHLIEPPVSTFLGAFVPPLLIFGAIRFLVAAALLSLGRLLPGSGRVVDRASPARPHRESTY